MSLSVSHLSKSYAGREVLHDISFNVAIGEVVGFLGPNGAGKSTCMKIITGWLTPDSGQVFICGDEVGANSLETRRRLGYLSENNPLYPEMYVREYLEYVGRIYRLTDLKMKVDETLQRVGLFDVVGKRIETLSKGYRQRVGLAQALLHKPQVLILDEPSSGLDPNQVADMHDLIREVSQECAVLFSSHSLKEVEELSSRTVIIHLGRVVADEQIASFTHGQSLDETFKELTR